MRYRDAPHVDLSGFYARRPHMGSYYRYLGYGACLLALGWNQRPELVGMLLICVLVAWVQAWYRIVGAAWRSSLVAAALLCAVILTRPLLAAWSACCLTGTP
jgi:hypothetical protein